MKHLVYSALSIKHGLCSDELKDKEMRYQVDNFMALLLGADKPC